MKIGLVVVGLVGAWSFLASPALADDAMNGEWSRGDGNARVRIAPCGTDVCATNVWIKDTSGGEEVGDRLVMTLEPKGAGSFSGKAYDAKRDRSYAIDVQVAGNALTTKGCIVGGLLCKSVSWARAAD